MTITINGTTGITTPEVTLDNSTADGGQVVLKSSGYSNWNLDNYSGRFRGYYGSTEYFTVDASGNMGIGTSSPQVRLQTSTTSDGAQAIFIGAQSTNEQTLLFRNQYYTNNTTAGVAAIGWIDSGASGGILTFKTGTNGGGVTNIPTERARIDSSGNLLVGTTTVSAGKITNYFNTTSSNPWGIGSVPSADNAYHAVWLNAARGAVGSVYTTSTATTYNTSSDYRLKENIAPMTGALSVVQQLKPCTYTWKLTGEATQGFIAHELAEVIPDAVTGEKDAVDADGNPLYQGIDTSFLVATLTAAIQELKAELDATKADVAALKGQQA